MHTVFALLCFVVVIHWLIFPYPSGLLHWHWGNLTIAPVPAKQPWWIWINTSCEFIMNDCITTTKQNITKPCSYFLGYTVCWFPLCPVIASVLSLGLSLEQRSLGLRGHRTCMALRHNVKNQSSAQTRRYLRISLGHFSYILYIYIYKNGHPLLIRHIF